MMTGLSPRLEVWPFIMGINSFVCGDVVGQHVMRPSLSQAEPRCSEDHPKSPAPIWLLSNCSVLAGCTLKTGLKSQ